MSKIHEVLQRAIAFQNAGNNADAVTLYQAVLKEDPRQPDALHLLGLIASSQKNYATAEELIRRAIEVMPNCAVFYGNLGVVLRNAERFDEAIVAYRRSLSLEPNSADTHFNLGKSLKLTGDIDAAEFEFRKAIQLAPQKPTAWLSLMNILADRQQFDEGISLGLEGLKHCPTSSLLHINLGVLYKRNGVTEKALEHYRQAVALDPKNVEALCRLANTLIEKTAVTEGRDLVERALAIDPLNMHVLTSLGVLQNAVGEVDAAEQTFRKAVGLYPTHATAYVHLCSALRKQGKLTEALDFIEKAIEFDSISAEATANQAGILMSLGRLEEAEARFREALQKREGFRDSHANLLMCKQYSTDSSPESILQSHQQWNDLYATNLTDYSRLAPTDDVSGPLRVGFVSSDLGLHPVGYFTVRMFEALQKEDISSFIYSDRPGRDSIAARIEKCVSSWNDVALLSDRQLTDKIREDRIDILFDLAGHTAANRLMVFARRAAPIQISWAGYVGTTGLAEMDYLLADRFHVPIGMEQYYREQVLRMPNGYVVYDPPADAATVTDLPALKNGYVTFASACNPAKVNPQVLEVWASILHKLPDAQLYLSYTGWPDLGNQERVRRGLGPAGQRVGFFQSGSVLDLLKWYGSVDMVLDTFPYSGGLTTCESLWMGVPTITFAGSRFSSRHSLSHLSNVGLTECIANDREQYVSLAINFANNLSALQSIRASLRERMSTSPLCDGALFARQFTELMQSISRRQVLA